jgi:hypothetical protein
MEPFAGLARVGGMEPLDPRLTEMLRRLPVPPPRPGFATRVFAALPRQRRVAARPWALALAASLVTAIGLSVWVGQRGAPAPEAAAPVQAKVVVLQSGHSGPVRLSFRSPRDLAGVTIHLQLPAGVELAGHPGRQSLKWQADFQAGANVLELPLVVREGDGGILTATLDSGASHKAFTVQVRAGKPAALFPTTEERRYPS